MGVRGVQGGAEPKADADGGAGADGEGNVDMVDLLLDVTIRNAIMMASISEDDNEDFTDHL